MPIDVMDTSSHDLHKTKWETYGHASMSFSEYTISSRNPLDESQSVETMPGLNYLFSTKTVRISFCYANCILLSFKDATSKKNQSSLSQCNTMTSPRQQSCRSSPDLISCLLQTALFLMTTWVGNIPFWKMHSGHSLVRIWAGTANKWTVVLLRLKGVDTVLVHGILRLLSSQLLTVLYI